jgi:hypothetical protein
LFVRRFKKPCRFGGAFCFWGVRQTLSASNTLHTASLTKGVAKGTNKAEGPNGN